ncbi:MAG: hypothetical protein Q7W45_01820 [Bacteroidota bacterium]|nr:hypothetical protein [Bacteroidota bacterium]MDP3147247.1 hypothetical protein [Bacteroidota bacterium]
MKTEKELNEAILHITMKINGEFPELSKYLKEMPVKSANSTDGAINIKNLKDYYDSLNDLYKKYCEEHKNTKK